MIRINKNTTNSIIVTLTENSTVANPIYLFEFINQQSLDKYYFISTDTSLFKQRYNEFQLTEKLNANTLNGEVTLGNEGFYDYNVYQTSLSSLSGLTTAEDAVPYIVLEVETGLVDCVLDTETIDRYNPADDTTIVYQN